MSLNPGSMDSTQNQTYEGIAPRKPPAMNGDSSSSNSQLYMGIDLRTRDSTDKAQYMGLKDARA